jgi:hypothetical protein
VLRVASTMCMPRDLIGCCSRRCGAYMGASIAAVPIAFAPAEGMARDQRTFFVLQDQRHRGDEDPDPGPI